MTVPSFFRPLPFLVLLLSASLASAADRRELSTDAPLLAQARQLTGQDSASLRALFGLSPREDLREVRSVTDNNGVRHTRYRQTLQGIPVWGEEIVISRNRAGGIVGLHGTLVTDLANDLPQASASLTAATALNAMKDRVRNGVPQGSGLFFKNEASELVVYVDGTTPKVAYAVSFFADTEAGGQPTRPYFIVDAAGGTVLFTYEGLTHAATSLLSESSVSGSSGTWHYYPVTVSAGQAALYVTTSGPNGDADLYVRFGSQPTTSLYTCQSIGSNSNESCVVNSPTAGTWYIGVYAWAAYSGLSVSAKQFSTQDTGIGPGGNLKTGEYYYGLTQPTPHYPSFNVLKDGTTCILNDTNVKTVNLGHATSGSAAFIYTDPGNACYNAYNTTANTTINGAYTPLNDAHYFGRVVYDMYNNWLGVPPLTFQLTMRVHYSNNYENAFWDGSSMTFGDGYTTFYPLVSLDVSAHEVSHGFTEQQSGLTYSGQSGGINEAYSDIAGEAAEFFMRGGNDFLVGAEIFKSSGGALRYMCNPTQDGRSIDNAANFYNGLDVHYSSGVYNKAFCLLAKTSGWGTRQAFEAFAVANMTYWVPSTTFVSGARGVYDAACDQGWNTADVVAAFSAVGVVIDTSTNPCGAPPVDAPPTISITAPGNNSTVWGTITITANATDDKGVTQVQFFVDGTSIGIDTTAPYSFSWNTNTAANGPHVIAARVTDTGGTTVETDPDVTVTVDNKPVHVGDLSGTGTLSTNRKNWSARVTITAHNASHALVAGITVTGTWSGGITGTASCVTQTNGTCTVTSGSMTTKKTSATFTMTNMSGGSGYFYLSSANDKTAITVTKP